MYDTVKGSDLASAIRTRSNISAATLRPRCMNSNIGRALLRATTDGKIYQRPFGA